MGASSVVTVNTSSACNARNVLRHAISLRPGVYEEETTPGKGNILWSVQSRDFDGLTNLKSSQCVSRLPGMAHMCHKVDFARAMAADGDDDSDENDDGQGGTSSNSFWPRTWIMPDDSKQLKSELRRNGRRHSKRKKTYIFKPDAASQGDGIVLIQKAEELRSKLEAMEQGGPRAVVQEYIDKPLLLDGCKFDLRIYVLVVGRGPDPHVFICKEGIARLCVQKYEEPSAGNLHKSSTHLTNYSINSTSADFDRSEDGSKRLMSAVLDKLHASGAVDKHVLWSQICESVATTVQLMVDAIEEGLSDDEDAPTLPKAKGKAVAPGSGAKGKAFPKGKTPLAKVSSASSGSASDSDSNDSDSELSDSDYPEDAHFHVLGFDVLMDKCGQPILLEVNSNPSLKVDAAYPVICPTVVEMRARADALRLGAWDGEKRFFEKERAAQQSGSPGPGSYDVDDFMRASAMKHALSSSSVCSPSKGTSTTSSANGPVACQKDDAKVEAGVEATSQALQVPFESQNGKYTITPEAEAAWLRTYG